MASEGRAGYLKRFLPVTIVPTSVVSGVFTFQASVADVSIVVLESVLFTVAVLPSLALFERALR